MKSFFGNFWLTKDEPVSEKRPETTETDASCKTTEVEGKTAEGATEVATESEKVTAIDAAEPKEPTLSKQPQRKTIRVCKMGYQHTLVNVNNQDFAFNLLNMKVVTDGCGSNKHSEVGTKLFGQLFARKSKEYFDKGESICEENFIDVINSIFENMLELCSDISFIVENYCFTILVCFELDSEFVVYSCGDGYIIKENDEGIFFDNLDEGEYPPYYIYNYIKDKAVLKKYQEGVEFKVTRFSKSEWFNVGVASDGLRYAEELGDVEKTKLIECLHECKGPKIEVLINRNNKKFRDDISICF